MEYGQEQRTVIKNIFLYSTMYVVCLNGSIIQQLKQMSTACLGQCYMQHVNVTR